MNDGFNETDPDRLAKSIVQRQQAELKARMDAQESEEYMENIYDFHKFTADPKLRKLTEKIKEIDKNWVFGNYNPRDEEFILMSESLLDDINYLLPEGSPCDLVKTAVFRDIFSRITVSRGRGGFAAKLFVTQMGMMKTEISGLNSSKKGFFSKFKKS